MTYQNFIQAKRRKHQPGGFHVSGMNDRMHPFQRHIVKWACHLGRAAIFADCGLGKTIMQLEWARQVAEHSGKPVLILAPLAVAAQTAREAARFGIRAKACRHQTDATEQIVVTNYEMMEHFEVSRYAGIVLDESSILKDYAGKRRTQIIDSFSATQYRLACTATPSPNDYMELGNHAEFLGVTSRTGMLATYFNHDGGDTSKWRLKGHAVRPFWEWVGSWSIMIGSPADLGFEAAGYDLPPIERIYHTIQTEAQNGYLFPVDAGDLSERRDSRRISIDRRIDKCAELVSGNSDQWLVWGELNAETTAASDVIDDAVEVAGSDSAEQKERCMLGFADGEFRVLVTKPKIAGHGMNWQNCHRMVFLGLSDSFEQTYQAERRCWRYGQTEPVDVHIMVTDRDGSVVRNIERKRSQADEMRQSMIAAMRRVHQ